MHKVFLALLLMLSLSFAWTSGVEPPACFITTSINEINFSYSTTAACVSPLNQIRGLTFSSNAETNCGSPNTCIRIASLIGSSNLTIRNYIITTYGGSANLEATLSGTVTFPTSGNYTFNGTDGASHYTTLGGVKGSGTITEYNSTHYLINGSTTAYAAKGSEVAFVLNPYTNCAACSISIDLTLANWNVSTAKDLTISYATNQYSYTNITSPLMWVGWFADKVARSDLKTGGEVPLPAQYCRAVIYYSGALITPRLTYDTLYSEVYPYFYNASSDVSYLSNNSVNYVLDDTTGGWYYVPPITCDAYSNSDTTSVSTLFFNTGTTDADIPLPVLPLQMFCREDGDIYNISSTYGTSQTHTVVYWNNSTTNITSSIGTSFAFTVNTTTYPNINYTVGGQLQCLREEGAQSLFGMASLGEVMAGFKPILILLWMGSIAISIAVPFAAVFPIMLNDLFQIVSAVQMALIFVAIAVLSFFVRGSDKVSIKSGIAYLLFAFILLAQFYLEAGDTTSGNALTGWVGNMTAIAQDTTQLNFAAFALSSAPSFLISTLNIIITAPIILQEQMLAPLQVISPLVYGVASAFTLVFLYGAYLWIALKAYGLIRNIYRDDIL